ncbi:uncharacterized protein RJT20DRAFT_131354 [Scheffersomyces xylosifermentans]|uniref:uncharacterized protein n=1 Tax=Scheffersomyces xylosifermentans TaxID=1304137 RepID=UPI00315D280F
MSANDILDVLNVQRDESKQPVKKKQKTSNDPYGSGQRQSGMARELYNLLGPNTPPVNLPLAGTAASKASLKLKASPWTKMPFKPNKHNTDSKDVTFSHWVKGSRELLEQEEAKKPYFFEKYNVKIDIPELVDEETYEKFMEEIKEREKRIREERRQREKEKREQEARDRERREKEQKEQKEAANIGDKSDSKSSEDEMKVKSEDSPIKDKKEDKEKAESIHANDKESYNTISVDDSSSKDAKDSQESIEAAEVEPEDWSYEETQYLFELCGDFELKWPVIYDRFSYPTHRSVEDLKEQFYRICIKILENQSTSNPALIESLSAYSKPRELERKQYLENLLRRTPAEIAEEESLVIEARRFELAAKKMLIERSHLLTLLDSPQTTQQVQQFQSSQGLTNLYNNLMIIDKNQKKRQLQQQQKQVTTGNQEPVPPPIPIAASSSFKKDRSFQTHLQQYLSGLLKQSQNLNPNVKRESNAIQQLLMKRLTQKEEEAYGLFFHGTEKLNPGVILRSTQKLPGLQQKQSVLKSVNAVLQELDIPTAGGTSWKPVMPTRKTMTKYDELIRSVVALLELKKGKDKLEAEIRLIKSQRGLQ